MHHAVLDRWSRGGSLLHRRDARAKIAAALVFLAAVATARPPVLGAAGAFAALLAAATLAARLPLHSVLARSAPVLAFALPIALISFLSGDPGRAEALLLKSCLSAWAVLLLVATTPLPRLLHGLESLGAPRMLVLVIQFVYRYLFVISGQAQHMRLAARCRGDLAPRGARRVHERSAFRAAAGAVAVLFGRSYERAEAIYRAMLARGFHGHIHPLAPSPFRWADAAFLAVAAGLPLAIRLSLGGES